MLRTLILLFSLFFSFLAHGQEIAKGDSSVVSSIQPKLSFIYNNKDTTIFFLTKQALQRTDSYGTSIIAYLKKDTICRVVTSVTTREGVLSAEYYLEHGRLIFSYLAFEYFDEVNTNTTRVDFKGIRSWESRYYFVNEQIKYQTHSGIKEESGITPPSEVLNDNRRILKYIKERIKR